MIRNSKCLLLILALLAIPSLGQTLGGEVNHAIDRGVHRILMMQRADGAFPVQPPDNVGHNTRFPMGVTAFALYALLNSGVAPDDPSVKRAVEYLRYLKFQRTYSVSMLVLALSSLHDPSVDDWIRKAAAWLESKRDKAARIWGYPEPRPDLSNTQLAVLALFVAEKHGYKVRQKTWYELVMELVKRQNSDGGFGYSPSYLPYSSGSMATAGMTILYFAGEKLENRRVRLLSKRGLEKAWDWLERVFTTTGNPAWTSGVIRDKFPGPHVSLVHHYYYLYGLERMASLSNKPIIADRDWYREGSVYLLQHEKIEGGWGGLENTCFALLFLRRVTFSGLMGGEKAISGYPPARLWRYVNKTPPAGWADADFDDKKWFRSAAGFGNHGNPNGHVRTKWEREEIWLRREFYWGKGSPPVTRVWVAHDDDMKIWINGILAVDRPDWSPVHIPLDFSPAARAAIRPGRNVIAAYCRNNAGAKYIDIRFKNWRVHNKRDPKALARDYKRWWRSDPPPVPYLNRWLILGPVQDPKNRLLHGVVLKERELAPREGQRGGGRVWKTVDVPQGHIDMGNLTSRRPFSVYCAFTWLDVSERSSLVLWFGASGGAKVYLDGKVIHAHFLRQKARPGEFRIPLRLEPGLHRLLVKVENEQGGAGFYAQISDREGGVVTGVRPNLKGRNERMGDMARTNPTLFNDGQLLTHLKQDPHHRLEFDLRRDVQRVAVGPSHPGFPRWLEESASRVAGIGPNPGRRGILAVRPLGPDAPTRVIRKVRIPRGRSSIQVAFSLAEVPPKGRPSGASVRIGVFDGTMHWLRERILRGKSPPRPEQWDELQIRTTPFAGKDVLLVMECAGDGNALDAVFIDTFSLK